MFIFDGEYEYVSERELNYLEKIVVILQGYHEGGGVEGEIVGKGRS